MLILGFPRHPLMQQIVANKWTRLKLMSHFPCQYMAHGPWVSSLNFSFLLCHHGFRRVRLTVVGPTSPAPFTSGPPGYDFSPHLLRYAKSMVAAGFQEATFGDEVVEVVSDLEQSRPHTDRREAPSCEEAEKKNQQGLRCNHTGSNEWTVHCKCY
jgi:hypothetical protein